MNNCKREVAIRTLDEVGKILGMSRQAVAETEKRALAKLRRELTYGDGREFAVECFGDEWVRRKAKEFIEEDRPYLYREEMRKLRELEKDTVWL